MKEIKTYVEIIGISKEFAIKFIYVPNGYSITKFNFEGHRMDKIGKLNSFNRLKILKSWRQKNNNLVKLFTELLLKKDWDFIKYPNPMAFLICDNRVLENIN
jgi:hypothetical protein